MATQLQPSSSLLSSIRNFMHLEDSGVTRGHDYRFLDHLDNASKYHDGYSDAIQGQAFSLPMPNLEKELPRIEKRESHWYEEFCCSQPEVNPQPRRRKPRAKRRPTIVLLPNTTTPTQQPNVRDQPTTSATADVHLVPLTPAQNLMVQVYTNSIQCDPKLVRVLRTYASWVVGPARPIWIKPIPPRPDRSDLPPRAHSRTQLWHKSMSLQPSWGRGLVRLGRILQSSAMQGQMGRDALRRARGEAFEEHLARKCIILRQLAGQCVLEIEQQAQRVGNAAQRHRMV